MRLDTFKTAEVKDAAALAELLKSKGIENDEREPQSLVILTGKDKKKDNKKEDPSLRTQMLRWYNANPDMLAVGVNNLLRITREKAMEGTNTPSNFVVRTLACLSKQKTRKLSISPCSKISCS